jgi:hypothetical protein
MSNESYSATAADSIIYTPDGSEHSIEIHRHSGGNGYLGFGEAGVVGEGVQISAGAPYYKIGPQDPRLLKPIHMICDTVQAGGIETS